MVGARLAVAVALSLAGGCSALHRSTRRPLLCANLLEEADTRWSSQVERTMGEVQELPGRLARRLQPHSPRWARALSYLQVDSPLILSFAAACIGVQACAGKAGRLRLFSVAKPLDTSFTGPVRLVGHVFGHVDWSHLRGNLLLLLLVGPPCETAFGSARLSKVMLWTALASSASHVVLAPINSVQTGASGVVFAMILLNSLLQRESESVPVTFVLTATLWLQRELMNPVEGVAHTAHLVGAAVGTYFGHQMHLRRTWWGGTRREFVE